MNVEMIFPHILILNNSMNIFDLKKWSHFRILIIRNFFETVILFCPHVIFCSHLSGTLLTVLPCQCSNLLSYHSFIFYQTSFDTSFTPSSLLWHHIIFPQKFPMNNVVTKWHDSGIHNTRECRGYVKYHFPRDTRISFYTQVCSKLNQPM